MTDTYNKGKDYLRQFKSVTTQLNSLKSKVAERFLDLCTRYPDAPVSQEGDMIIKAKGIADKSSIDTIPFEKQIEYIISIEKWVQDLEPFVQGDLFNQ